MAADIRILDILKMLRACAPDHDIVETTHSFLVKLPTGAGVVTGVLPSGSHLKLERRKIRTDAVRSFARKLGILDCARRHLPL